MADDNPNKKSISERLEEISKKHIPSPDSKGNEGINKGRVDESLSNEKSDGGNSRMPNFTYEDDSDVSDTGKSKDD